jgi:hypothetical protein
MLTRVAVRDYHPIFRKEAILLASAILKNPDAIDKHIQRTFTSATMSILYDYPTLSSEHDETLTRIHAILDCISAACAPGAYLVEVFPWMILIPERYLSIFIYRVFNCLLEWNARLATWKREAKDHFIQHSAFFGRLLDTVSNDIVSRPFLPCAGYPRVAAISG